MKILVSGSRGWTDEGYIDAVLSSEGIYKETILVGDATGVDAIIRKTVPGVKVFKANWNLHGIQAGILRNIRMFNKKPYLVIVFWDGESPGSRHVIYEALRRKIQLQVYFPRDEL